MAYANHIRYSKKV